MKHECTLTFYASPARDDRTWETTLKWSSAPLFAHIACAFGNLTAPGREGASEYRKVTGDRGAICAPKTGMPRAFADGAPSCVLRFAFYRSSA